MSKRWHKTAIEVWDEVRLENLQGNFNKAHFNLPLDLYVARLKENWPVMELSITYKTALNYFSKIRSMQTESERSKDAAKWEEAMLEKARKISEHRRL